MHTTLTSANSDPNEIVRACRQAQRLWQEKPIRNRLAIVRSFRHLLVERADPLLALVEKEIGRAPGEVTATDLLPTAGACRLLERRAERILSPRSVSRPPLWLMGCRDQIYHRPRGVVGLIGTWNYPIFLNLVPLLQALVAGNGVVWKPSEQVPVSSRFLHQLLLTAGFPAPLIPLLGATRDVGPQLLETEIDFLHFTGSESVGRRIASRLAERLIPSALELSGCDTAILLPDANLDLAARCIWYGMNLNAGQTCMATRRVLVPEAQYEGFVERIRKLLELSSPRKLTRGSQSIQAEAVIADAVARGATVLRGPGGSGFAPAVALNPGWDAEIWTEPLFAPVLAIQVMSETDEVSAIHNRNRFGLTAAIFTEDRVQAESLAERLEVGSVVINDVIVPTAHPETAFGGCKASGWGVTQGEAGLLQMTRQQVVTIRKGKFRPHVDALIIDHPANTEVVRGMLRMLYARGWGERFRGLGQMIRGMRNQPQTPKSTTEVLPETEDSP